jgi:VIT1/CCC1 family predicted Fe2+/Mn2+ transporter
MNSREQLLDSFKRIAWLERKMRDDYAAYRALIAGEEINEALGEIENDEIRHMNMAQRVLSILEK